jgi:hypothetical protein
MAKYIWCHRKLSFITLIALKMDLCMLKFSLGAIPHLAKGREVGACGYLKDGLTIYFIYLFIYLFIMVSYKCSPNGPKV